MNHPETEDQLLDRLTATAREALGEDIEKLTYVSDEGGGEVLFTIEMRDGRCLQHRIRHAGYEFPFTADSVKQLHGVST